VREDRGTESMSKGTREDMKYMYCSQLPWPVGSNIR